MWDKKISVWIIVSFLLILPIVFADGTGGLNRRYGTNFSIDPADYIAYCIFNVSDTSTIQPCETGNAWTEDFGDLTITDEQLVAVSSGNQLAFVTQDFSSSYTPEFTCSFIVRRAAGGDVPYIMYVRDSGDGDAFWFATNDGINNNFFFYDAGTTTRTEFVPAFDWRTATETTLYLQATFNTTDGSVRANISNFTVSSSGVVTLKLLAELSELASAKVGDISKIRFGTVNAEINYTEAACYNGTTRPTRLDSSPPTIKLGINNTIPRINDDINISFNVTDDTAPTFVNMTINFSTGTIIANYTVSVNIDLHNITTITDTSGNVLNVSVCGRDASDNYGCTSTKFTVAGTTPPNVTIHGNNFFASDNSTIISLFQTSSARLNFSFTDDIDLFGFIINITLDDTLIFNLTNITLNGPTISFNNIINFTGPQGTYKVNISVEDAHTAKKIPYYDVRKGFNWLEYDGEIRIKAEGAIWASTTKYYDRYDFRFRYLPFIPPKNKVFYVESNSQLIYRQDSGFKAHFVDYNNKRWIDFEGLKGRPIVTKINDRRWKIEFANSDSEVIFNSIGGLNEDSFEFEFYLSNVSISFFDPLESPKTFLGTSFSVSLNVTGNGRNETQFRLYNSSNNLTATANVSATGTGTYFYNVTFTGLIGTQFFVNATHIDINGQISNSTTVTLNSIQIEDCSFGFPAINFTIKDEMNDSRVRGDSAAVFDYNGTTKNFQFTKTFTNQDNFSICIFPPGESLLADYEITYDATGYPQRVASASDISFSNATQTTDLLLLATTDGIFVTFRIIDSFQNPLSGVTSSFAKAGVTIETRDTDDAGIVSFFVNPDTTYVFTFIKAGFATSTNSLRITSADIITITLETGADDQVISFATGISYFFQPQNKILNNNTDFTFSFNLTSSFWNITGCSLRLKNASEELAQGDCQFNGSQSNVSIIFNTGNQSIIIAEAEYELNGTTNNTVSNSYRVENVFVGRFSLKNFLDDITSFSAGAFDDFNRFIIAILITLLIVGGLSLGSADFREPEILIPITWLMVAFFSYLGWMNIPLDTIPQIRGLPEDWLNKWNVFILITLLGGAYLIRKHLK